MITLIPNKTEKTYQLATQGIYSFIVQGQTASKQAIKAAVESQHQVTVLSVRVNVRNGKPKRYLTKNRSGFRYTTLQDKKIAYVTLKTGDKIQMFEEEEVTKDAAQDSKTVAKELKQATQKVRSTKAKENRP